MVFGVFKLGRYFVTATSRLFKLAVQPQGGPTKAPYFADIVPL